MGNTVTTFIKLYIIYKMPPFKKNSIVINGSNSLKFTFYYSENSFPFRKPASIIENYLVHERLAVSDPTSPGVIISKADIREVESASK